MQSINFSTTKKKYAINGDENNVIEVDVSDLNLIKRFEKATPKIEELEDKFKDIDSPTVEQLEEADHKLRTILNEVFESDVCTPAFGNVNCLSPVANGKFLFEAFVEALMPMIKQDIKATAQASKIHLEEKTSKYTAHLDKPVITTNNPVNVYANHQTSALPDISNLTPEQKKALAMELFK